MRTGANSWSSCTLADPLERLTINWSTGLKSDWLAGIDASRQPMLIAITFACPSRGQSHSYDWSWDIDTPDLGSIPVSRYPITVCIVMQLATSPRIGRFPIGSNWSALLRK